MPNKEISEETLRVARYVGAIVKEARLASGMTQRELGEAIGLTGKHAPTAINALESGRQGCSVRRLFQLAAALGIHPMTLLDDTVDFSLLESD